MLVPTKGKVSTQPACFMPRSDAGKKSLLAPQAQALWAGFRTPFPSSSPTPWKPSTGLAPASHADLPQGGEPGSAELPALEVRSQTHLQRGGCPTNTTPWPASHFCKRPGASSQLGGICIPLYPRELLSSNAAETQPGPIVLRSHNDTLLHLSCGHLSLSYPGHRQAPGNLLRRQSCALVSTAWAGCCPPGPLLPGLVPPGCTAPAPYRFGRDVCVRDAPVLAHDRDVAVHIDRLRVAGQHRDPAGESRGQQPSRTVPWQHSRSSTYPFSPLLMNFWTSFTPRRICLCLDAAREAERQGERAAPPPPAPAQPRPQPDLS